MGFEKNIGHKDRIIRIILAVVIFAVSYLILPPPWYQIGYLVSVILLLTALIQRCLLYYPLGINTTTKGECSCCAEGEKVEVASEAEAAPPAAEEAPKAEKKAAKSKKKK